MDVLQKQFDQGLETTMAVVVTRDGVRAECVRIPLSDTERDVARHSNPIESTFASMRHRTKVTRDPCSRSAGFAIAFKLIEAAQDRWRAVDAPKFVALVRAGAGFGGGELIGRPDEHAQPSAA